MFLGALPYKSITTRVLDKVLVLDTEDMIVEYISVDDLNVCHVEGINDYSYVGRQMTYNIRLLHSTKLDSGALRRCDFIPSPTDPSDIFIFDGVTKVILYRPDFNEGGARESLVIGKTTIHRSLLFSFLQYVLRYREYYILRFLCGNSVGTGMFWMSVAVNKAGLVESYWSTDFTIYENENLGRKVDIISCI